MGDHKATYIRLLQMVADAQGQALPDFKAHVLAVNLRHLLGHRQGTVKQISQARHTVQQIANRNLR